MGSGLPADFDFARVDDLAKLFVTLVRKPNGSYKKAKLALDDAVHAMGEADPAAYYERHGIRHQRICLKGREGLRVREEEKKLLEFAITHFAARFPWPATDGVRASKPFIVLPVQSDKPLRDQTNMLSLVGHYLILRRIFSAGRWGLLVSHMHITPGEAPNGPLNFHTTGAVDRQLRKEPRQVIGQMFQPIAVDAHKAEEADIYAVGMTVETNEGRFAILQPRNRRESELVDLAGIRLGIGAVDGKPRGYFVWASRMPWDDKSPDEIKALQVHYVQFFRFAGPEPTLEETKVVAAAVYDFQRILREDLREEFIRLTL